jgi:hypothetical protein
METNSRGFSGVGIGVYNPYFLMAGLTMAQFDIPVNAVLEFFPIEILLKY